MARAGILYSHVAQAAAQLAADGKNPTVDSVRETLGGTGSKSTIAPLLKRWKVEHQDTIVAAESGLPASLLQAVKGLHQHMQTEFEQQLGQVKQQLAEESRAAVEREQQLRAELQSALATNTTLMEDLATIRQALAQLQNAHHSQSVTLASTQAENAGLQQRLADRAAEVATLDHQLTQTRAQFEHYQEATAAQRAEERLAFEQRAARLEQGLAGANRQIALGEATISQQEARIIDVTAERDRQIQQLQTAQEELITLRSLRDRITDQVRDLLTTKEDLAARLAHAQDDLTETRTKLMAHEKTSHMLTEQASHAQERADRLAEEKLVWARERGALEQRAQSAEQKAAELSGLATKP